MTLWINQSGNGWSAPVEIVGTPPVSDMDAVRLADVLGVGISGVLWTRDAESPEREHYFFLDFTGRVKPYLLCTMDNHMGAVTQVEYVPSTRLYLEDQQRPQTRWQTPLPFPVQVVARVEVIDEISRGKLTTEYSYHHGYWDGAEREFRGFGRVDQRDSEEFDRYNAPGLDSERPFVLVEQADKFSPPLETRTWFHQGPIGDEFGEWEETDFAGEFWPGDPQALARPAEMTAFLQGLPRRAKRDALRTFRGRIIRTELYTLDGTERKDRPYTVTEYLHGVREESTLGPGDSRQERIFFSHSLGQRVTQWERGDDPMTQLTFTDDYDVYGQPCSQISIAVPRGRNYRERMPANLPTPEKYLATHTLTDYAQRDDANCYIVDRVARTTTHEIENDGRDDSVSLKAIAESKALDSPLHLVGQTINHYDGLPFAGMAYRQLGAYGALVRSETLILTEQILQAAYPELPPFLATGGVPAWTPEYPQEFRTLLRPLAGLSFYAGVANDEHLRGYFSTTCRRYDFQEAQGSRRGLLAVTRDPMGHDTALAYDDYQLLPVQVTDPAGLMTARPTTIACYSRKR